MNRVSSLVDVGFHPTASVCGVGPVMMADNDVYSNVTAERVAEILQADKQTTTNLEKSEYGLGDSLVS